MKRAMFGCRVASLTVCVFAMALFLLANQAQAGEFTPTKPIQMIAAAAPGGGSDVMARTSPVAAAPSAPPRCPG